MALAQGMTSLRTIALLSSLSLVLGGLALGCGASAPPPTSGGQAASGPEKTGGSSPGSSGPSPDATKPDEDQQTRGVGDGAKGDAEGDKKEAIADKGSPPPPPAQASATSTPLAGRLTQQEIADILSKNAAYFNDCYTIGAGKGQEFRGTVTVKATLGPSGNVTDAQVIKTTAKNAKVDACVVTAFKKIKFPAPSSGGTSVITFPMEFQGVEQVK
jgi:TonB family protein